MTTQLEFGEKLKECGIERVKRKGNDWNESVVGIIEKYLSTGEEFTSCTIRHFCHSMLVQPEPHHPNAWGAALNSAAKRGLIKKTGLWVKSNIASTHARMIPVWIRL